MLFQRLSNSNTFSQWVTETQKTVGFVNELTDGYRSIYANTNVTVGEDLHVNGNVLVTGTFILDEIDFDDLTIAGNLTVDKSITSANGEFLNLNVVNNVATFNVTTNAFVGQNAFVYGDLNSAIINTKDLAIQGNLVLDGVTVTVENLNVLQNISAVNTTTLKVGTEGTLYGKLNVVNKITTTNLKSNFTTYDNVEVVKDLYVSLDGSFNNVSSVQNVTTSADITTTDLSVDLVNVQNLQINQNVTTLNVTNNLFVGQDAEIDNVSFVQNITTSVNTETSNLSINLVDVQSLEVTENIVTLNVTNNLFVGEDATIYGNLNVINFASLGTVNSINIATANIQSLIGSANTQIYNTIDATTAAVTVAANVGIFTGFILALG